LLAVRLAAVLLLCASPIAARAATPEALAQRWAPIHYQDTDSTSPTEDYLAGFDYDGNLVGTDNWEHLFNPSVPYARVYYAVAETCTHWFISYGFYHPHDWSDGYLPSGEVEDEHGYLVDEGQEHENDLEDAVVVVRKDATEFGHLEGVLTQAHGGYRSWRPAGSPLVAPAGRSIDGVIPQEEYPSGSGQLRPVTAQQAKGHGLGAKGGFSDFAGEPDRDGIIYWPTGVAGLPLSGNDRNSTYALESLLAAGGLWEQQLAEDLIVSSDRVTYLKWGKFRGDESGGCGHDIDITCVSNAAAPPWGQDDGSEPAPRGAPALDPADMVRYHFTGFDDYDLDYVTNSFIVSLRDNGYGPQTDGSVRVPSLYEGPDLATYFNKLVGPDGDGDSVHSCTERVLGTDPRSADSDLDGVNDGVDALPLDPTESVDTDGDGTGNNADEDDDGDGVADAQDAFPLDSTEWADNDGDGHGDNADTDDDNDGLSDQIEVETGTDPLDSDSDGDGLLDGVDVEFVQNAMSALPPTAYKSPSASTASSFRARLDEIEGLLLKEKYRAAIRKLTDLRLRVDGCGGTADSNDWIVECAAQLDIRQMIDLLIQNVSSDANAG
jgi:hypothetical protein